MNIPITKTVFTKEEFENILKPLKSGWVVQGPFVSEFEKKWSNFTGAKYSVAVSNCTTALHLSLAALGIGHGDEVIVPSFTWVATANAVESLGAKPVFCDIDLRTFNIDVESIEKLQSDNTMAIIPVHLFGLPANMGEVMAISSRDSLFIIEDAACGFGAKYKGKHVGNLGDTGCFSFHPRKAITTGEGGMITVNDKMLAEKLRAMRDHGATTSDHQKHFGNKPYLLPEFPYLGFNYRMTDIQASIGTTQMDRADMILKKRLGIAAKYDEFFDSIPWLEKPFRDKEYEHGFQAYVCLFKPDKITLSSVSEINKKRNDFMDYLQKNGISTRPGTHAVHMLKYYAKKYKIKPKDFPNSFFANHCSIAFPLYSTMSEEEFDYIKQCILKYKI
jgi:perosamine synthetase